MPLFPQLQPVAPHENGGFDRVYKMDLPDDPEAASMVSLDMILRMIREGREDPVIRNAALDIVSRAGIAQRNKPGQICAIHFWVRDRLRYVNDPVAVETLIRARDTHRQVLAGNAWSDCDDHVIYEGSLLESLGIPVRAVILKSDPNAPRLWSHILLEANDGHRWVPLDPIVKDKPPGWHPPKFFKKKVFPVGVGPKFPEYQGTLKVGQDSWRWVPDQYPQQQAHPYAGHGAPGRVISDREAPLTKPDILTASGGPGSAGHLHGGTYMGGF